MVWGLEKFCSVVLGEALASSVVTGQGKDFTSERAEQDSVEVLGGEWLGR